MTSVFRRVTKYTRGEVNPRENRLTEVFGGVLAEVPGLPNLLAANWATDVDVGLRPVWVTTQRPTPQGHFIDLELCFGARVAPELRVWVEVKHGASLGEDQLEDYAKDLRSLPQAEARLILLAPRHSMPEDHAAADAAVSWQDVVRLLAPFTQGEELKPEHRWLIRQLLMYLREERLVDEERVSAAHAVELGVRPSSERAVARLTELAQATVKAEWGGKTREVGARNPKYGTGWWATFGSKPARRAGWRNSWFEWSLFHDAALAEPLDSFAFFAGATFANKKDTILSTPRAGPWLAARGAEGFEYFEQVYPRVQRVLYPEQLLVEQSLEEQARSLARWVLKAFRDLEASPPP